eukprot:scaffold80177_cov34-Attheya_sp.AAC.4
MTGKSCVQQNQKRVGSRDRGIGVKERGYGSQSVQRFAGLRADRRVPRLSHFRARERAIDAHGRRPDSVAIELLLVAVWTGYIALLHDRVGTSDGGRGLRIRGQSGLELTDQLRLLRTGLPPVLQHVARHCDESTWPEIDSTSDELGRLTRDLVSVGYGSVRNILIEPHPIRERRNRPENFASRF